MIDVTLADNSVNIVFIPAITVVVVAIVGRVPALSIATARIYQFTKEDKKLKFLSRMLTFAWFIGVANYSSAAILGSFEEPFIENSDWVIGGWACDSGTSSHVTVLFYYGTTSPTTYIGSTVVGEDSEPEVATACSNSETDLRFKFNIPSMHLAGMEDKKIWALVSSTYLTNSGSYVLTPNYDEDPISQIVNGDKLLFITAHTDDHQHFVSMMALKCLNANITCGFAAAQGYSDDPFNDSSYAIRNEYIDAIEVAMDSEIVAHDDIPSFYYLTGVEELDLETKEDYLEYLENEYFGYAPKLWAKDIIENYDPDYVLITDPRFGNTCSIDHNAISEMVVLALQDLSFPADHIITASHRVRVDTGSTTHKGVGTVMPQEANATQRKYFYSYSGDTTAYSAASSGPTVWDWQLEFMDIYESAWGSHQPWPVNQFREWIKPLHYDSSAMEWIGNEFVGRMNILQWGNDHIWNLAPFYGYTCPSY